MSIFEAIMLICFGAAWPFSIHKSWVTMQNTGKSILFLFIVLLGYISGIINKLLYNFNGVIYLYILNAVMVTIDIIIYYRNKKLEHV
ncbi:MAG: hypothetical protein NT099_10175 [Candidatus Saganbacteria bacterium]|nr:hypothetical protein [Candidatus Saganbacteria bacterium]